MSFDISLLWLIGGLCGAGFGLLVLFMRHAYPDSLRRVLTFLGAANLCLGASYFARCGGAWAGQSVFHVLSTTLVVACLSLNYRLISELKHRSVSLAQTIAPPALMFFIGVWLVFVQRNITIQLLVFNSINVVMMILIAWILVRAQSGPGKSLEVLMACSFSLQAFATLAVMADYLRSGAFPVEYNFNVPRSFFNSVAAIVTEGVVFPLFLLMISEHLNRDLTVQAMRDPLTGLYNRRAFEEIAFRELAGASRTGQGLSLLIFDVDALKQVNDELGHLAGDAVLVGATEALRRGLRDEDFLCRWGGDEFCALLPRAKQEQARNVAERVLQSFKDIGFSYAGKSVPIAVSAGIVTSDGHRNDLESLVGMADGALYRAKLAGRNQFAVAVNESSIHALPDSAWQLRGVGK